MKTTIDIPEEDLKEAIKYTGAKTKRDAMVYALAERKEKINAAVS